jgi:hypothetical protein
MTAIMNPPHGTSLETRPSLLNRLKSGDDPQGWKEFYKIYGGLIRFFAQKAGLTADVAQTLGIGVARVYLTKHRVSAQLRKEVRRLQAASGRARGSGGGGMAAEGRMKVLGRRSVTSTALRCRWR